MADLLARGGIPNVRLELEKANTAAKAEGRPETPAAPMLKLADEMWPSIKLALWRDRVDAVLADLENVGLRDLRAVVSESESVARDDETRLLGAQLREALEKRTLASRDAWNAEIDEAIVEGRIVRALRLSVRAPDPATRLDADRAKKLADAASAAMTPDIDSDRWLALLEAVAASPVRRLVKPVALPTEPTEALVHLATQESSRIPALVQMLGLKMPPPPRPPQGRPGANLARPKQRKTSGPTPNPLRLAKPAVSAATSAAAKVAEIAHDVADVAQAVVDKVETVAHNVVEEVAEIIDNAREAGHEAVEDLKEQAAQTRIDLDVAVLEARGVEPEAPEAPVEPTAEAVVDAPGDTDPSSVPDETPST